MQPQEFKELLDRYAKGACTEQEEKFIHDWYDSIGKRGEEQLESDVDEELLKRSSLEDRLWSTINPKPGVEKNPSRYFIRVAAAVMILAMAGTGVYFLLGKTNIRQQILALQNEKEVSEADYTRIVNNEKKARKITLEDGSQVTLKANSEIRVAKNFDSKKREVYLSGEAFFKVKRDTSRPFLVYANEVVTKVLGTSFTIKAYDNEKEITVEVKTGKVSVYRSTNNALEPASREEAGQSVILTPNQKVIYDREKEKVSKQLVEKPRVILPEPTLFEMSYDGAPVTKIFEVLEENYGVDIQYDEAVLSGCVLTTSMSDEGLYERINVICRAINAEYTITEAVIIIESRGCM